MQNASQTLATGSAVATWTLQIERRLGARLRRAMVAMLAAWLGYFAFISMSVRALNKVMVPLLHVQLGMFLVAQGTAILFLAALVLLVKASVTARAAR